MNYSTFYEAALAIYQGDDLDHDPSRVVVAGSHYVACGPTTGEWVGANGLEECEVVELELGNKVVFAQ